MSTSVLLQLTPVELLALSKIDGGARAEISPGERQMAGRVTSALRVETIPSTTKRSAFAKRSSVLTISNR